MEETKRSLTVGELAKLCGVSVRTLHYYDEAGLLRPKRRGADYRVYGAEEIARLQEILFYRELELPVAEIRRILSDPAHDRSAALRQHRALLVAKQGHLKTLLALVDQTLEGGTIMKNHNTQSGSYEETKRKYRDEVKARYGGTEAFRESEAKDAARTPEQSGDMERDMAEIFSAFAAARTGDPAGEAAQALVARWQAHISTHHYRCTDEILCGLAQMYTGDERFRETLDAYGTGTAQFMHDAMMAHCGK